MERGGGGGESERTPVNIVNKGSFRYTGFQYTSLLPTDRLNVRLRATEIRFAYLKEGKPLLLFIES